MAITVSFTCENSNNLLLLMVLYELLERLDMCDTSNIATYENCLWLIDEIKGRVDEAGLATL